MLKVKALTDPSVAHIAHRVRKLAICAEHCEYTVNTLQRNWQHARRVDGCEFEPFKPFLAFSWHKTEGQSFDKVLASQTACWP